MKAEEENGFSLLLESFITLRFGSASLFYPSWIIAFGIAICLLLFDFFDKCSWFSGFVLYVHHSKNYNYVLLHISYATIIVFRIRKESIIFILHDS